MRQLLIDKPEGLGVYPFVSLEEMTKQIFIKAEAPKEANVGDILLYNKTTSKMKLVKSNESLDGYDTDVYSPVGVVMIPSNHDIYGTGEFTVISLDYMDYSNPATGSTTALGMYWGDNNYDIPELTNFTFNTSVPSTNTLSQFNILSDDGVANHAEYIKQSMPKGYSPYTADGNREQRYIDDMKDFDGKSNTDIIMTHITTSWQSETITNSYSSGNYPAACCCRRYSVLGTNPGDWYLGAVGEMGYMIARFQEIQDSISKIKTKFSKGGELNASGNFWCSTEYSANFAYLVYTGIGYVYGSNKFNDIYVRALLRVSQSQL